MKLRRLLAAVVLGGLLVSACTGKNAVDQTSGGQYRFVSGTGVGKTVAAADRKKAGEFTGDLLNGGKLALSESTGKVTVINFWATWCGPCTVETPQFDSVYRANKAKGVAFIGIDTKETSTSAARAFIQDNDISYPILSDEKGETAVALGKIPSNALPFTVILDKQQRVAAVYLRTLTPKDLQPVLDKLIAES
ncbi:MAG: TlpA family protein disulfide reductase [Candidatus Nephthysia bennettiae]|nr:MAG: TlpA family protein disulfide reductase [Candidatus Dormibacteraeota bacterium]